jgi:NAD-dependent oxidoreductase involved in siderophore biosynthesis
MKIQPVKTAIVGCGTISDAYLSTMMKKFKILDVMGCCDRNLEKAETTAQKYGITVLTLDEILADDAIEMVVNLTQPVAHYPVIKQLLEAGKHVYTEKVLSVELEHAAELVKIADQKNCILGGTRHLLRVSHPDCQVRGGQRHAWRRHLVFLCAHQRQRYSQSGLPFHDEAGRRHWF